MGCSVVRVTDVVRIFLLAMHKVTSQQLCSPFPFYQINESSSDLFLNDSVIDEFRFFLKSSTLEPSGPSATAVVGSLVFANQTAFITEGIVDKNTLLPATTDTIFRMASVSKLFVVESVLQEYENGAIRSLDDELNTLAPDFFVQNPFGISQPTIRQLISQTAGLRREVPGCNDAVGCNVTTDEVLSRLSMDEGALQLPPQWQPGYSNLAFGLLGNIIAERVNNQTFENYLQQKILKPLNMTSSGTNFTANVLTRMATPYSIDGTEAPFIDLGWGNPDGGIFTTAHDSAIFLKHLLKGFQTSAVRRQNMQPNFVNPNFDSGFGSPWELYRAGDIFLRTKSGDLSGYQAQLILIPEFYFGMTLLWNGEGQSLDIQTVAAEILIPHVKEAIKTSFVNNLPSTPSSFLTLGQGSSWNGPLGFTLQASDARSDVLQMILSGGLGTYWLQYLKYNKQSEEYWFQTFADNSQTGPDCMVTEFLTVNGAYLIFNQNVSTARYPGEFPEQTFFRVDEATTESNHQHQSLAAYVEMGSIYSTHIPISLNSSRSDYLTQQLLVVSATLGTVTCILLIACITFCVFCLYQRRKRNTFYLKQSSVKIGLVGLK